MKLSWMGQYRDVVDALIHYCNIYAAAYKIEKMEYRGVRYSYAQIQVVEYLLRTYGNRIRISLMSQYTPMPAVAGDPLLGRRVTRREYDRLVGYALDLGMEKGFIQERDVAEESFIPAFDGTGIADPAGQ